MLSCQASVVTGTANSGGADEGLVLSTSSDPTAPSNVHGFTIGRLSVMKLIKDTSKNPD